VILHDSENVCIATTFEMLLSVNKTIFQFENDGCFSCPCFVHCVIVINIDKFYITSMNLSIYTQCTFAYAFYMVYYFK